MKESLFAVKRNAGLRATFRVVPSTEKVAARLCCEPSLLSAQLEWWQVLPPTMPTLQASSQARSRPSWLVGSSLDPSTKSLRSMV